MKRMLVFLALILMVSGALFAQISKGGTAWVSVKTATLKSSAWALASNSGSLDMGAQVTVLQVDGNWAEVRSAANASVRGWTPTSNLSSRRVVAQGASTNAKEVALGGKGFNQEIENAYKADGNLNYEDVDRTEAITILPDQLYQFIVEGQLETGERR